MCQRFLINTDIVNTIIGDILWELQDINGETHANMLRPFKDFADVTKELEEGEGVDSYCIVTKNSVRISLAVSYLRLVALPDRPLEV